MPQVSRSRPIDLQEPGRGWDVAEGDLQERGDHQNRQADLVELLVPLLQDEQERGEHDHDQDRLEAGGKG